MGAGFFAGMGFTMSLFATDLVFTSPENQVITKVTVLLASVISGIIGYVILMRSPVNNKHDELNI